MTADATPPAMAALREIEKVSERITEKMVMTESERVREREKKRVRERG